MIRAEGKDGCNDQENARDWDDCERDTPRNVRAKAVRNEGAKDDGHDDEGNTTYSKKEGEPTRNEEGVSMVVGEMKLTTHVSPTSDERVGTADDLLVEEGRGPGLARNEDAAEEAYRKNRHWWLLSVLRESRMYFRLTDEETDCV